MFTRIAGTLIEKGEESVVIEVGGLGYEIILPPCVARSLDARINQSVNLEIYSILAMDGNAGKFAYYGFTNAVERAFFEALLSVSSIGPRSAARAFSAPMAEIAAAIDRGDHAFLKTLPGIGQQKARDIVAKLQGRVARFLLIREPIGTEHASIPAFGDEALDVLLQLGYKRALAERMLHRALEDDPTLADAEAILTAIYRTQKKNGT